MATKYPIILVHGIAVKEFHVVKAFGKIGKRLREAGYCVHSANTDGFGAIEHNAEQLKAEILKLLERENAEKVNIIAHSKGGLDSKYVISRLGMEDKVASLTTLSTPHRGAKLATSIYKRPHLAKFLAFWINLWYKIFGDEKPDALTVCKQLQAAPNELIESLAVSDSVFCQSYSATMERSTDDFLMCIPLALTRRCEGIPSDGLVTHESAVFGDYKGDCVDGSLSHTEIIGYSLKKSQRERVLAFWFGLVNDLEQQGF